MPKQTERTHPLSAAAGVRADRAFNALLSGVHPLDEDALEHCNACVVFLHAYKAWWSLHAAGQPPRGYVHKPSL